MKMNANVLIAAVLTLALFSCQPKDEKSLLTNKNVTQKGVSMNQVETNRLMALSLDRAVEALVLLKSVLNPTYADSQGLQIEDNQIVDDSISFIKATLKNKAAIKKISTQAENEIAINYEIESLELNDKNELVRLSLKSNEMVRIQNKGVLKVGSKKTDFSSTTMTDRVVIAKAKQPGLYSVSISKIEDANSAKDKQSYINSQIKVKFSWDGQVSSLDQDVFINAIQLVISRTGLKTGLLSVKDMNAKLTVKLEQNCATANGVLNLAKIEDLAKSTDPKPVLPPSNQVITITESTVEIQKESFKSKAQSCESRPLVDLTRMLEQ